VKKMLFALRSGMFSKEVLPSFITALKTIVKANFSTEVVRALATFVTSNSLKGLDVLVSVVDGRQSKINDCVEGNEFACQKDLWRAA